MARGFGSAGVWGLGCRACGVSLGFRSVGRGFGEFRFGAGKGILLDKHFKFGAHRFAYFSFGLLLIGTVLFTTT